MGGAWETGLTHILFMEQASIQHYPLSMARFGRNPYGENRYRIVFAPSRRHFVHGDDGVSKWVPLYRGVGPYWVLEKWVSPEKFAGMSRQRWEREMTVLGPWPERGEYHIVHTFEACGPVDANLDKLISWIEAGEKTSSQDVRDGIVDQLDSEQRDTRNENSAKIRDLLPAFGNLAAIGYGGISNPKTKHFDVDPRRLGLPTANNAFKTGKVI